MQNNMNDKTRKVKPLTQWGTDCKGRGLNHEGGGRQQGTEGNWGDKYTQGVMRERSTGGNTDDTNLGKWVKGSKSEYVTHEAGNYQSKTGSKITAETKTKTHRLCTREKQTWGQDRLGRQRNETERTEKLGIKNTNKWLRLNHKTHGNLENSIQQPDIIVSSFQVQTKTQNHDRAEFL